MGISAKERAKIRVIVKRILNKWGDPPERQDAAVKTILQQADMLSADWTGELQLRSATSLSLRNSSA